MVWEDPLQEGMWKEANMRNDSSFDSESQSNMH